MKFTTALFFLALVCTTGICTGTPATLDEHAVVLRQKRDVEILGNTRKLIEELVQNLRQSAQQAMEAIGTFSQGLQDQASLYADKMVDRVKDLQDRVAEAINKVTDKFTGASAAVRECIDSRKQEAEALFSDTAAKSKSCADQRIQEVRDMMQNLRALTDDAMEFSNNAIDELKMCTELNSGSILATGRCLASVALQAEMKGAVFLTQSGLSITRINLAVATLPAALDVCAGSQLLNAGVGTAKLVMEIGSCSTYSVVSTFTGNSLDTK